MLEAVVGGIGIQKHAGRAALLRHEGLHATEALAVANENYFSAHVDLRLREAIKVLRRAVVRVNNVGFNVSRGRHAVERRNNPGIVLKGVARDALRGGSVHP